MISQKEKEDYKKLYGFYINGYRFKVLNDSSSESEINITKTPMYVSSEQYGYNDIQWKNFTGETITLTIYSNINETYTGDKVQPLTGAIHNFYDVPRTPHAVLKYWAQNFVPFNVRTGLQSHENGVYVVDEGGFTQKNPYPEVVVTDLKLVQYESSAEKVQTYWTTDGIKMPDSSDMSAKVMEIDTINKMYKQECACTMETPRGECTSVPDEKVKLIQQYLQQWGYFPSYSRLTGTVTPNGVFCYMTTQALAAFQYDNYLEPTGRFDNATKEVFKQILSDKK